MSVHNHGAEEDAGLACHEIRQPDGTLKGECMAQGAIRFVMWRSAVTNRYVTGDRSAFAADDAAVEAFNTALKEATKGKA